MLAHPSPQPLPENLLSGGERAPPSPLGPLSLLRHVVSGYSCRHCWESIVVDRTLDVTCRNPGVANFAVTEKKNSNSWRWAIFDTDGSILGTGCEPTQALAHTVAERALESSRTRVPFQIEEGIF